MNDELKAIIELTDSVLKGGPGSGSWESPGNPRFEHRGKPEGEVDGRSKQKKGDVEVYHGTLLKNVKNIMEKGLQKSADPTIGNSVYTGIYFDVDAQTKKLQKVISKWLKKVIEKNGEEAIEEIVKLIGGTVESKKTKAADPDADEMDWDDPWVREQLTEAGLFQARFDVLNQLVVDYIRERSYQFSFDVNTQTMNRLKEQLAEGFENGESIRKLKNRVKEALGFGEGKKENYRATRIARSEAIRASNYGSLAGYIQSDVVGGKQWYTARGERTCAYCSSLHGKVIGVDEKFLSHGDTLRVADADGVVSSMRIDYEDIVAPPLHPNCRCTLIPLPRVEYMEDSEPYLKSILKGGPGSGSWESPGNPRFEYRGKPKKEEEKSGGIGETISLVDFVKLKSGDKKVFEDRLLDLEIAKEDFRRDLERGDIVDNKKLVQEKLTQRLLKDKDFVEAIKVQCKDKYGETIDENVEKAVREYIRGKVSTWASTSGDTSMSAIAMQMAVAKEFNFKKDEYYLPNKEVTNKNAKEIFKKEEILLRKLARAQYEETQSYFKEKNIKEMVLYRGVGGSGVLALSGFDEVKRGFGDVRLKMMPISSFSTSGKVAYNFAENAYQRSISAANLISVVPVSRIFSTPLTGFGCSHEKETVVLGGKIKSTSIVLDLENKLARVSANSSLYGLTKALGRAMEGEEIKKAVKKESRVFNIDENLDDADWVKQSWDLPEYGTEEFDAWLKQNGMTLASFKKLPVWKHRQKKGK